MRHVLMENRNGLAVDAVLSHATGTAEREAALTMVGRRSGRRRITLGVDKAFDVGDFVKALRSRRVTPHVAIDGRVSKLGVVRRTEVDGRTTRHTGYRISQVCRKQIEEVSDWLKAQAGLSKVKVRGRRKAEAVFCKYLIVCRLWALALGGPDVLANNSGRRRNRQGRRNIQDAEVATRLCHGSGKVLHCSSRFATSVH